MLVRVSTVLSAVAVLLANQAVAAPGQDVTPRDEVSARAEMAAMIATDPCRCLYIDLFPFIHSWLILIPII